MKKQNRAYGLKKLYILLVAFALIFAMSTNPVFAKSKTKLTTNANKTTIYYNDKNSNTSQLTVKYGNKNVTKKAKYSTSNKKVATVNKKGKVTAKKAGKVTIKVKYKGKTNKIKITVKKYNTSKNNSNKTNTSTKTNANFPSMDPNAPAIYCKIRNNWLKQGIREISFELKDGSMYYATMNKVTKHIVDENGKIYTYDEYELPPGTCTNPHMNALYKKVRKDWMFSGNRISEKYVVDDLLGFTIYCVYNETTDQTLRMDGKIYNGAFAYDYENFGDHENFY